MFKKYFFKNRFIKELKDAVWTENINADFAKTAYDDLMKIQENDIDLLKYHEDDLKDISNQEHANKESKEAVKTLKMKINNLNKKIDLREHTLEQIASEIQSRRDKAEMYNRKIDFVKKHG